MKHTQNTVILKILTEIEKNDTASDITGKIDGTYKNVVDNVNILIDKDYITKKHQGRSNFLTLTAKGKRMRKHARQVLKLFE